MNKLYACNTCEAISGTDPETWNQDWHYNVSIETGTAKHKCSGKYEVYISQDYLYQSIEKINNLCSTIKYAFPENKKVVEDLCEIINQAFNRLTKELE